MFSCFKEYAYLEYIVCELGLTLFYALTLPINYFFATILQNNTKPT